MSDRVLVLRDAVVKITQMLSGKGIKVTQRGVTAYVRGDHMGRPILVNLPYLPDNATDELCYAIQGFLDHEVAHIMFSDFSVMQKANKAGCGKMLNALEDPRVEKCMGKKFAGCASNLSVTGKFFLDKFTVPKMKEAMEEGDMNKLVGVLLVPLLRAMSGQWLFKEFMRDKMESVKPIYEKIKDLESQIERASSTEECFALAQEIEKRLRSGDKSDKKSEDKNEDGAGDEGEGESKSKKSTKSKGKAPESKAKSEEKEGESDEESKDEGESDEGEKSEKSESGEDDSEEGEDDSEEGGSEGDAEDETESDSSDKEVELGDTSAIMAAVDKDSANGFDEAMSVVISDSALGMAKESDYLVFTKDDDVVEPLKVGRDYRPEMFVSLADKVDHMVGPLQKDLERAIAARSLSQWENGRRSGRMHAANLSRLACGDDRVFRKKHEANSKDVAVSLVIDASGSMAGAKIHLATQAAYALSQVLERIGIKHEVICFTTGGSSEDRYAIEAEVKKLGRNFSRSEPLYMPILKSFDERLTAPVRDRFGWLPNSSILRNNVDGECVEVAAHRLKVRRETGKVMIVLSDGSPSAYGDSCAMRTHLTKVVAEVTKSGVKVVGIGIMDESVRKFYPKNLVINDVTELPNQVIKELRHLLVA
jgi:cobalamin biosynthesis protein CobT